MATYPPILEESIYYLPIYLSRKKYGHLSTYFGGVYLLSTYLATYLGEMSYPPTNLYGDHHLYPFDLQRMAIDLPI